MGDRRNRGLRRRRDAGQDESGTHRNIARDVSPPPEMLSVVRTTVENPWQLVLGCLASSGKSGSTDPPPRVKMLDTVLMEDAGGGHPEDFFFTASDGSVQRKAESSLSLKSIEEAMLSRTYKSRTRDQQHRAIDDPVQRVVAMARTRNGEYISVTSKALRAAVKSGALPAEFDCLHPFVRAKDFHATQEFANYQHEYVLSDTGGGVPNGTAYRRVKKSEIPKSQPTNNPNPRDRSNRDLILSRQTGINVEMNAAATAVVLAVERMKRCRVLRLSTEFVADDQENVWLVGVTRCSIASRPEVSSSRCMMSSVRGMPPFDTIGTGTEGSGRPSAEEIRVLATEKRSRNRQIAETARVLSDNEFSRLLEQVGYRSPMRQRSHRGHQAVRRRPPNLRLTGKDSPSPKASLAPDDSHCDDSGRWLSTRLPLANVEPRQNTTHHESAYAKVRSSLRKTTGNENIESEAVGDSKNGSYRARAQQPFPQQRLAVQAGFASPCADLDQVATNMIHGSSQLEGCRGDFCEFDVGKKVREEEERKIFIQKAARAAGAADGLVENLTPVRLKILSLEDDTVGGNLGGPSSSDIGVRSDGRGPRVARHTDNDCEQHDIPYKAVVQARHERILVEAFLRRYARGEEGEYVRMGGGGADERYLVGGRFPGVYYRPVKVCSNCQMVYTLVDQARGRALRRIRAVGDGSSRKHERAIHRMGSVPAAMASMSSDDDVPPIPDSARKTRRAEGGLLTIAPGPSSGGSDDEFEHSAQALSLAEARQAIDAISQGDVSELRSFCRPPAAVVHVTCAAIELLSEGKSGDSTAYTSWAQARAVISSGDFLSRLRTLNPRAVRRSRIRTIEPALESPEFHPAAVRRFSNAAANLSLWVLGMVQANRWMTGKGHHRTNIVPSADDVIGWGERDEGGRLRGGAEASTLWCQGTSFTNSRREAGKDTPKRRRQHSSSSRATAGRKRERLGSRLMNASNGLATSPLCGRGAVGFGYLLSEGDVGGAVVPADGRQKGPGGAGQKGRGRAAAQAFASNRLMNPGGQTSIPGENPDRRNEFVCADGRTRLPYRVCGDPAPSGSDISACNFVVVHDFFDNVDKTEVLFRPVTRKHRGCRVLTFAYPGQAGTVFEVPHSMASGAAEDSGAIGSARREDAPKLDVGGIEKGGGQERREAVPNNAFIAPRLHELLQHVHGIGDMRLTSPFHLVGIGNGTATAIAFALRYGDHPLYRSSLRSIVSINGFSSVDPQLAAVLHSSINAFATLPPARPDLPVSFMSRYVFSEEYLTRVGRNLALGIFTAVSNPITIEGRHLVCNSALLHKDLSNEVGTLGVPLVLLQSTEDVLVNPANVDPFLRGRSSVYHFWSHEFRVEQATSANGSGNEDAVEQDGCSVYGQKGLTDLLRALSRPGGTFVAWVRAGHEVRQESKRAVMDLLDTLAKPTSEYTGVNAAAIASGRAGANGEGAVTLGLYPSADFVARVNKRPRIGAVAASREVEDKADKPGVECGDKTNENDGDPASIPRGMTQAPMETSVNHSQSDDEAVLDTSPSTVLASPFPRDIHIPTLPSPAGRHRMTSNRKNANRLPNTSPIKRSHATMNARIQNARHRGASDEGLEAFAVLDDERGARDRPNIDANRDITERWKPLILRDLSETSSSNDQTQRNVAGSSRAGRPPGTKTGPAVVWEERSQSQKQAFPPIHEGFPRPYSPIAGSGHDVRTPHHRDTSVHVATSEEYSPLISVDTSVARDAWDLVGSTPSLELTSSTPRQRAKRRWVSNDGACLRGDGEIVEPNDTEAKTSPTVAIASELIAMGSAEGVSTAQNTCDSNHPVDSLDELLVAEACLEDRLCELRRRAAVRRRADEAAAEHRITRLEEQQQARSKIYVEEDEEMILKLEQELAAARVARAPTDLQRANDGADLDDEISRAGIVHGPSHKNTVGGKTRGGAGCDIMNVPSRAMPPIDFIPLEELPDELQRAGDAYSLMADAARDEAEMARIRKHQGASTAGGGNLAQFQRDQAAAASDAAAKHLAARMAYKSRSQSDIECAKFEAVKRVQPLVRGVLGRRRAQQLRRQKQERDRHAAAALKIQTIARGCLGKERACRAREAAVAEIVLGGSALRLQSVGRGMLGRRRASARRREVAALTIQRYFRGHLGRRYAAKQWELFERLKARHRAAVKIQANWRRKHAVDAFANRRAFSLAAVEIQRTYRGVIGRRKANRRLDWAKTKPGPARLKLGMRMIEDTKVAFERQRMEIDALHLAEEKAVVRTGRIRKELGVSERELGALEREMHEIDHIESQLQHLTHQRSLVEKGLLRRGQSLEKNDLPAPAISGGTTAGERGGVVGSEETEKMLSIADKEAGFALEMQIQMKRAEREKKRQELEADFRGVCGEVDRKRRELERVGDAIQEIEATRERKISEFRRMQANLMELLHEQKTELDAVREKGVQLEVATATSAAAATATAQRAKDHEEKSSAMFSQTEELMKFQFMSMSLSYFSSLNMLKTMRNINADTTTAAVTSSADAAAAAAASAAAASLPALKAGKVLDSISDVFGPQIDIKRKEMEQKTADEQDLEAAKAHPFPREVKFWTTTDVGFFLESLGLRQYRSAFEEAAVDGDVLLALNAHDCADVLGVEHTLHSKKLFLAIDRLRPLSKDEQKNKAMVEREEFADNNRGDDGPPNVETVFSQVRNGRMKRLDDSLDKGFPVDTEDEHGNSTLMVACQNVNVPMCEVLMRRGANINHQNARGNTALHYAMAYDSEGLLGEMLISSGADDSLENREGLTCYDGLGA